MANGDFTGNRLLPSNGSYIEVVGEMRGSNPTNAASFTTKDYVDTAVQIISTDTNYTIGVGGDYATIQAWVDAISILNVLNDVTVTGTLLTGFVMSEQVTIKGKDLSFAVLTSVDPTVTISRAALTTDLGTTDYGLATYPAFFIAKGTGPQIDVLFDMDTTGTSTNRDGIFCIDTAKQSFTSAAGVTTAARYGLFAGNMTIANAKGTNFGSAGTNGIAVSDMGIVEFSGGTGTTSITANTWTSNGYIAQ